MAAGDRTKRILSEARILLNDTSRFKYNDLDLYRVLNNVIREVYRAFGGFEKTIVFDVTDDDSYSLASYGEVKHKYLSNTWDTEIELLPPYKFWKATATASTGNPYYATIFNDTLYIYPTPDFAVAITSITRDDPAVVTTPAHGLSSGDSVYISGAEGLTQLNGNTYYADVINTTQLYLSTDPLDLPGSRVGTSEYNAYTGGGMLRKGDAETLTLHCVQVYPALPVAPTATVNVSVADPESPERHDEILAYAVASKYNPELREVYLEKLSEAIVDYHAKSLDQVIPDCEW